MSYFDMLKETWFSPKIMPSVCPNLYRSGFNIHILANIVLAKILSNIRFGSS